MAKTRKKVKDDTPLRKKPGSRSAEAAARAERARALLAELADSAPSKPVDSHPAKRKAPTPDPMPPVRKSLPAGPGPDKQRRNRPASAQPLKRNANAGGITTPTAPPAISFVDAGPGLARPPQEINGVVVVDPNQFDLAHKHRPKKHAPGALKFMDVVFYRNHQEYERMFVEAAPPNWNKTAWIRITDKPLREDRDSWPNERQSFCVHADMVELAPPVKNVFHSRLPTPASVAQKERAKAGVRDVGDEIAQRLRACKSIDEVYDAASDYLGVPKGDLLAKYKNLNPGQQRMNLGNRMRNKWKKEHA